MANNQPEKPYGRKMQIKEYKGIYTFDCTELEDFASFKCRDDDVWVCSFPRSGNPRFCFTFQLNSYVSKYICS